MRTSCPPMGHHTLVHSTSGSDFIASLWYRERKMLFATESKFSFAARSMALQAKFLRPQRRCSAANSSSRIFSRSWELSLCFVFMGSGDGEGGVTAVEDQTFGGLFGRKSWGGPVVATLQRHDHP
jgi:hypothetical protein